MLGTLFLFFSLSRVPSIANANHQAQPIGDEQVLFIVHPYRNWDFYETARKALDLAVEAAKEQGRATAYVLDSGDPIYLKDQDPKYRIMAPSGLFPNRVTTTDILLAGGNWGYCLSNTLGSLLANAPRDRVRVKILSSATFIFLDPNNLARHLKGLNDAKRNSELKGEFQSIVDRWLKDVFCLTLFYGDQEIGHTAGKCTRRADIMVSKE
jgi:hypothetical protein